MSICLVDKKVAAKVYGIPSLTRHGIKEMDGKTDGRRQLENSITAHKHSLRGLIIEYLTHKSSLSVPLT